ncbi:hypothetical protein MPSEU_000620900 [Mayamaea pseudoterrestris]|nr:hypothetical protein MPSEU_000620900 [Mayamaea pseudoterrestris]
MSRHRNLRQMVHDDDYYDDDDDGDGYYDEYDDYPVAPRAAASSKATKNSNSKTNNQNVAAAAAVKTSSNKKPIPPAGNKKNIVGAAGAAAIAPPTAPPPGFASQKTTTNSSQQQEAKQNISSSLATRTAAVPKILLNEYSDKSSKERLTVIVLGHVDAGKSTVTGHLLSLCNNSKSKANTTTNYAWLLDENVQERARGITMDVATKTLQTSRYQVILLDAPGHVDYVPAMITGSSQAGAAWLVVDATTGVSAASDAWNAGQLKEHVYLARGLGVKQLLVVVNKMDVIEWSQTVYDRICESLTPFLNGVGFTAKNLRFVPVSGLTGANIRELKASNKNTVKNKDQQQQQSYDTSWYKGPTLLQALDEFDAPSCDSTSSLSSQLQKPLRIVLTDIVGEQTKGVTVRGKVVQGWIKAGDSLVVLPVGDVTMIQKLTSLQPSNSLERNTYAVAGEVIDCTLSNIDIMRVATGNVLSRPKERPVLARKCRAMVWMLEALAVPMIRGGQAILHINQLDVPCVVSALIQTLNKDGSVAKENPRALTSSTQAIVELTLSVPIVMEAFEDCRALGRFVLRRSGQSIAVGRIEKVLE